MTQQKTKRIQGLFAVLIIFHHLSQMVSAPWLPDSVRRPGLELFVPVGYLLVAFFFFSSGYGLAKSMRSKEDYFDEFFVRRLNRVLFVSIAVDIVYIVLRIYKQNLALPPNPFSWYVYTLIVLYAGFFLAYRKKTKASFAVMCLVVLIYCVVCYLLAFGNWWINSVPAFLIGIFMAGRKEERSDVKRIILSAAVFALMFFAGENIKNFAVSNGFSNYGVINSAVVFLQMISSAAFSLLCYYISFKTPSEDSGNTVLVILRKVLSFLGGITLEIYLIHGIFVNSFGPYFISNNVKPYYYIKNIPLYVLVVVALSIPLAFGLKKLFDVLSENYPALTVLNKFMSDLKRNLLILIALAVLVTVCFGIKHGRDASEARKQAEEYKNANITMVEADGEKIAVYKAGTGKETMVLISSGSFAGSTLNLRPLADKLAEDYSVVIIDLPGSGFSPYAGKELTADHYADVIKGTLDSLGIKDDIVLVPHYYAGLYCYRYISKYPEGLKGAVFIDSVPVEIGPRLAGSAVTSAEEYEWNASRSLRSEKLVKDFMVRTGYAEFELVFFDELFGGSDVKKYVPAMKYFILEGYMNEAGCKEIIKAYANCRDLKDFTLPADVPAVFLISSDNRYDNPYGINWTNCYKRMITNEKDQTIVTIDNSYVMYYSPKEIKRLTDAFMGKGQ